MHHYREHHHPEHHSTTTELHFTHSTDGHHFFHKNKEQEEVPCEEIKEIADPLKRRHRFRDIFFSPSLHKKKEISRSSDNIISRETNQVIRSHFLQQQQQHALHSSTSSLQKPTIVKSSSWDLNDKDKGKMRSHSPFPQQADKVGKCEENEKASDAIENIITKNLKPDEEEVKQINEGIPDKEMKLPINPTNPLNVLGNAVTATNLDQATTFSIFEKMLNFRDLSEGEKTKIKSGILFRSGLIHTATDKDFGILENTYGIKTIIDMRSSDEIKQHPSKVYENHYPTRRDFLGKQRCRIHIPLWKVSLNFKILIEAKKYKTIGQIAMNFAKGNREKSIQLLIGEMNEIKLPGMYKCFIQYMQEQIRDILFTVSNPDNQPCLIHCSLGKDRTGMMSSIISDIIGINRKSIFEEYAKSEKNLSPVRDEIVMNLRKYYLEEWLADSPIEVLEGTFDWIEQEYGSMSQYLEMIGFSKTQQRRFKQALNK